MERLSTIKVRESGDSKTVRIGSTEKPAILDSMVDKWQMLIDTAARIVQVPSGLIMRLNERTIEVFIKSNTEGNPYEKGEEAELIYGLYCETVIGTQESLLVPNARTNPVWQQNNPDVDINMISYLGFPLNWPDGEVFGTVCILDEKENHYSPDFNDLILQLKHHLERDLALHMMNSTLQSRNAELEQLNQTKSRFLSLISHDIRGSMASMNQLLQLLNERLEDYTPQELHRLMTLLSQNASTSYHTLENLLSWSKSDLAQIQTNPVEVDLCEVIEAVLAFFKQHIYLKKIRVEKTLDCMPAKVHTVQNMITMALRNIISNAIKYNREEGSINVSLRVRDDRFAIIVSDTGIGMNAEIRDKLFSYTEREQHGTGGESSAGIGLMLTREFLDKIGAEINIQSAPDQGTSVSILI